MLDAQAAFVPFLDATAAADEPVVFLRSASSHLRAVSSATIAASPASAPLRATADPDTAAHSADDLAHAQPTDTRPVTPRRPLRFSSARASEDAVAVTLPVANLFAGIFDEDDLATADVDPRLARSRQRARAILAAREAALPAEEANLWHDFTLDPAPAPSPTPISASAAADAATIATADAARTARSRSGRPVRHLTSADLLGNRVTETPAEDPLQNHLHRVRDALYGPDPEGDAAAAAAAAHLSLPARCTAHAFNLALLVTALPLGAAMMVYTFLRGEDLRLSARMVAVTGTAVTVMQLGLVGFI